MDDTVILKEIRNALRYLVHQTFNTRSVPSEGGLSWEEQERVVEDSVERILKTGSQFPVPKDDVS